jgi:hypothetical protein
MAVLVIIIATEWTTDMLVPIYLVADLDHLQIGAKNLFR